MRIIKGSLRQLISEQGPTTNNLQQVDQLLQQAHQLAPPGNVQMAILKALDAVQKATQAPAQGQQQAPAAPGAPPMQNGGAGGQTV